MNRESFKKLQKDRITERVYNDWGGWEKSLKVNCVLTLVPSLAVQYYPRVKYCTANEETHQNNEGGLFPPPPLKIADILIAEMGNYDFFLAFALQRENPIERNCDYSANSRI